VNFQRIQSPENVTMTFQTIRKPFIILTVSTIMCRIVGLVREIITAHFFGTSAAYDAFLIAFMIPNFFRGILAEGALSTAFIPVLSEYASDPDKKHQVAQIASSVFTILLVATTAFTVVILTACGLIIHGSFLPARIQPVVSLLRFTFPYLIFVALAAWSMGILNVYRHFLLPGLNPIVLDFWWIASLYAGPIFAGDSPEKRISFLAMGVVIGGLSQFLFQVPAIKHRGVSLRLSWDWRHPALKRMLLLISPMIIGMSVGPINLLVDYSFARSLSDGMVSALWYATRIYQLPLGVFGVSLATVMLPYLSGAVAKGENAAFGANLNSGILQIFYLMIPAAAWMAIYRTELITVLFRRGLFGAQSTDITAYALFFYCAGLAFYAGSMIITRAFYACKDTATPVKIGIVSIAINALLDWVLMQFLAQGGIALSTSLVGLGNFLLLSRAFRRKFGFLEAKVIGAGFIRILLLGAGWSIILLALRACFPNRSPYFTTGLGILAGAILWFGFSALLGLPEFAGWRKWRH